MDVMKKKGRIATADKCQKFPTRLLAKRTVDDVLGDEEMKRVEERLREVDDSGLSADFFVVLNGTGLRIGEALALSLADFFPDEITEEKIKKPLDMCGIKSHGYIAIESQVPSKGRVRGDDGLVTRKPLKGRIEPESGRTIPIISVKVFNVLARRWNEQRKLAKTKKYGTSPSNYLLFDGLTKGGYRNLLLKGYMGSGFWHKSPHCSRHTFATNFAGMTGGNPLLCKLVLGHKDMDTTLRYIHLYEAINRKVRTKELRGESPSS